MQRRAFLRDVNDSAQELAREIEQEIVALEHTLRPLQTNPGHAAAVFDGIKQVDEILNLLDEAKTLSGDAKLNRALFVTHNFWNSWGQKTTSNEWVRETGQYLLGFPAQARKWALMLLGGISGPASVMIGGIQVRNATGFQEATDDFRDPIEKATEAIKSRRWGALLRSSILIIESGQMPANHRGHAAAMYRSAKDDILLVWPPPDARNTTERILHELGHRLWFMFLTEDYREAWIESWKRTKDVGGSFVTPYAASDPKEDFAEVFAHWALHLRIGNHEARLREIGVASRESVATPAMMNDDPDYGMQHRRGRLRLARTCHERRGDVMSTYRVTIKYWDRHYGDGHVQFKRNFEARTSAKADQEAILILDNALRSHPKPQGRIAEAWTERSDRSGPSTLRKYDGSSGHWVRVDPMRPATAQRTPPQRNFEHTMRASSSISLPGWSFGYHDDISAHAAVRNLKPKNGRKRILVMTQDDHEPRDPDGPVDLGLYDLIEGDSWELVHFEDFDTPADAARATRTDPTWA